MTENPEAETRDESSPGDNFERYVKFRTSTGAKAEFWTGFVGAAAILVSWPVALVMYFVWPQSVLAKVAYMLGGIAFTLLLAHAAFYFIRRTVQ